MTEAQEILDKLTEAQKRALLAQDGDGHWDTFHCPDIAALQSLTPECLDYLIDADFDEWYRLNATGLAVRALLEKRT